MILLICFSTLTYTIWKKVTVSRFGFTTMQQKHAAVTNATTTSVALALALQTKLRHNYKHNEDLPPHQIAFGTSVSTEPCNKALFDEHELAQIATALSTNFGYWLNHHKYAVVVVQPGRNLIIATIKEKKKS